MKFGKWISTKDLYIVTLKELVTKEVDVRTLKNTYIMLKTNKYAICRKKYSSYYDIFTNTEYESIYNVDEGSYGIIKTMPLQYNKKFVSLEQISEKLEEITEHEYYNKNNLVEIPNNPKIKKMIPFTKKY